MAKLNALVSRFICQLPRAICSALNMQSSLDGILHRAQRSQSLQAHSIGRRKDQSVPAALWTICAIRVPPRMFFSLILIFTRVCLARGTSRDADRQQSFSPLCRSRPARSSRHQMYLAARAITTIVSTTNAVICTQALLVKPVWGEICVSISVDHPLLADERSGP